MALVGISSSPSYAAIIGIDFGQTSSPIPTNWNLGAGTGTVNSLTLSNVIDETGVNTGIDVNITAVNSFDFFNATVAPATIPTNTNSIADIGGSIFRFTSSVPGGLNSNNVLNIEFANLIPNETYNYWLFGLRDNTFGGLNQGVAVTGATTTNFNQVATAASPGNLVVNSMIGSDQMALANYALSIVADSNGQINTSITAQDNSQSPLFGVAGIAIERQNAAQTTPEPSALLGLVTVGLLGLTFKKK